ncbi:MAG: leucyl/phenylalanyl-tRNA--protein transferase [Nitrospirae bacterium]|nr:MAG: leucyl/phenylalanyl-tRNA--protein transferase [Nitrospirota bacterium]
MPIYRLPDDEILFPPPELAEEDGLLAVGGDLSEERLLAAYSMGIFPWYSEGSPILWWSTNPRLILIPEEIRISKSLRKVIKKNIYTITMDTAFREVIENCASIKRKNSEGTWITKDMIEAYVKLHNIGFAHSVESWREGELVGGLYGVSIGSAFFGESMFSKMSDASKVAFVKLVEILIKWHFTLIDCQVTTEHLMRFGAKEVSRSEFMKMLRDAISRPSRIGKWTDTI